MNASSPSPPSVPLNSAFPEGRFDGRTEFQDWIRQALHAAAVQGKREIILCDANFRDWPLGESEVVDLLSQWIRVAGANPLARKCVLMAANFDYLRREQPRFVQWRERWQHLLECRQLETRNPLEVPSVFWTNGWTLQRADVERSRGVASSDPQNGVVWREKLREWTTSRSRVGFPSTILGL